MDPVLNASPVTENYRERISRCPVSTNRAPHRPRDDLSVDTTEISDRQLRHLFDAQIAESPVAQFSTVRRKIYDDRSSKSSVS